MNARLILVLLSTLLVGEALLVSLWVDASLVGDGALSWLLMSMGDILRWAIVAVAILVLLIYLSSRKYRERLTLNTKPFSWSVFTLHLLLYGGFVAVTMMVFGSEELTLSWSIVWLVLALLVVVSWFSLLWAWNDIYHFTQCYFSKIFLSGLLAIVVLIISYYIRNLWQPLSSISLSGASWMLSLYFDDVYVDSPKYLLGVGDFIVHISNVCSGLEGLVVALTVTSVYIYLLRRELRFPLAFVLLVVAVILSILFNVLRVAILVAIGALWSEDIAIGGFHSVAGWIAAVLVAFLMVFVFTNMSVFHKEPVDTPSNQMPGDVNGNVSDDGDLAWAILIPFILFLFATLFSQIFIQDFNYLYPLKVVVAVMALGYFWSEYQWQWPARWLEPIAAGAAVAVLWIFLVPADPSYDQDFAQSFMSMSWWLMLLWGFFRILGSWVIAPILEELVFRGYLIARLSGQELSNENKLQFSLLAIVVSSLLFAIIHSALIAGFVAGVVFAIVRYRGRNLSEPIVAHLAANVFVSLWAAYTGQWVLL